MAQKLCAPSQSVIDIKPHTLVGHVSHTMLGVFPPESGGGENAK